jgi:hypothetical protein
MSRERFTSVIIASPVWHDRVMHACGLFEPFKRYIDTPVTVDGFKTDDKTTAECIAAQKAAIEQTGDYAVVAIWRVGHAEGAWFDPSVKVVSLQGRQWCLLHDYLSYHGYPVELTAEVAS